MSRIVGIVGVGHVGAHCAFSLCTQGICDEIVLVDSSQREYGPSGLPEISATSYQNTCR
jgi:malate/lactate dehydrogenase